MILNSNPIIIGALHLPYYGKFNPSQSLSELEEYALTNCRVFVENGIKSVILQDENLCTGLAGADTIAVMSAVGRLLKRELPELELGIIVQAHDGIAPIAIAHATGASFVRIKVFAGTMLKSEGILNGCGIEAVEFRQGIGANKVKIFADAHDRTGFPLVDIPITQIAGWVDHTGADALILTGKNYNQSIEYIKNCKDIGIKKPLLIGGGVTIDNIKEVLSFADGAVVSTSLMHDDLQQGDLIKWDGEKIKKLMDIVSNNITIVS